MNQATLFKRYAHLRQQLTSERSKCDQLAAFNIWNATDEQLTLNEFELKIARLKIQKLEDKMVKLLGKIKLKIKETP